jgi:hypothetical protein
MEMISRMGNFFSADRLWLVAMAVTTLATPAFAHPDQINGVPTGSAFWSPMTFASGPPTYNGRQRVYATGEIQLGTAREFTTFLASHTLPAGSIIAFHSPGGNPLAGMELGEIIRDMHLDTIVAQPSANAGNSLLDRIASDKPGVCASSCSIAYLGGVSRLMLTGSLYGVHDVFLTKDPGTEDLLDLGQKFAGALESYFNKMGVRPEFLSVMTRYNGGKGELRWLQPEEMAELRVTTETGTNWQRSASQAEPDASKTKTDWRLENSSAGFALEGINVEANNVPDNFEKIVLGCTGAPRRVELAAYYMPEALIGDGRHAMQTSPESFVRLVKGYSVSVFENGNDSSRSGLKTMAIPNSSVIEPAHAVGLHHVVATISLTSQLSEWLTGGTSLTFNFNEFAGVGGVSVDLTSGRKEIVQFLENCDGHHH